MVRAAYLDKNGVRKGAWSQEEDDKLRAYVQKHGDCSWRELPKLAGLSRCGKSCRLRWLNYIRPDVKHGNYSKEEQDLIVDLHEQLGNRWSMIAAKLPGRSDNAVKNFWHAHLKRRVKQSQKSSCNTSPREICQETDENMSPNVLSRTAPSNPILESNPLSPQTSCSEFSCSSSDSAAAVGMSGTIMKADDGLYPYAAAEELSVADFWTEPFVADNTYDPADGCSSFLAEGGFMSPYDYVDMVHQMMLEFVGNY